MLKIETLNCNGDARESIIDETKIVGMSEIKREPQNLYDECGNLVETKEIESTYKVFFENGREVNISKTIYDKLVARFKVETL